MITKEVEIEKNIEKDENEFDIKEESEKIKNIDDAKIEIIDPSSPVKPDKQYEFAVKELERFGTALLRTNLEKVDWNNYIFMSGVSFSSVLFPIIVDRLQNKKGFKDITVHEMIDVGFGVLPSIFKLCEEATKNTKSASIFHKLQIYSRYMTIRQALRKLVENIKLNDGKINTSDPDLFIYSFPFVVNNIVLPTVNNPNIIKRLLQIVKILFGKKIADKLENKKDGILRNINVKTDDLFDFATNSVDVVNSELKKRNLIKETESTDAVSEIIADRGINFVSQILSKPTKSNKHSSLGAAHVGKRNSFV